MFGLLRSQLKNNVLKVFDRTMAFYAVAKGRKVGIYANWAQCEEQVKGFKGAVFKKFNTRTDAEEFIGTTTTTRVTESYTPQAFAVPLGRRRVAQQQPQQEEKQQETKPDFWPEDVAEEGAVTEDEMMAVMYEVEGFPEPSTSRKRKADDDNVVNSKSKLSRHASKLEIGAFTFNTDSDGYVIVYTDGSCLNNGQKNACAGFGVYFGDEHPLNVGKPVSGRVTNNVGEIQSSIYAIKIALDLGIEKLSINTDSKFLINSITKWVSAWKKRGWLLKNKDPVKNVDDFKELDELLQNDDISVKWIYVAAHKGIKGNEMADKLARQGSQLYREMNS